MDLIQMKIGIKKFKPLFKDRFADLIESENVILED